jgi:hypothetical protein
MPHVPDSRLALVRIVTVTFLLVACAASAAAQPNRAPAGQAPDTGAAAAAPPARNECLTCHSSLSDERLAAPARLFGGEDIHRRDGFACVDCHGGAAAEPVEERAHATSDGFKGKPVGPKVIATCARCHSDAAVMRRYSPKERVDQEALYATSVHGVRLRAGDPKVATCISCHGAHGIRLVSDARAPVFPTHVAETCAKCHADPKYMAGYSLPDGSPLPTDQFAKYQQSVHYTALTKGNDLSAPTCNDCHGNHGAVPPNVESVANVCGTCHTVEAEKFKTSPHAQLLECLHCHSNHAVLKPGDEMIATSAPGVCANCHSNDPNDKGGQGAGAMRAAIERLKGGIGTASAEISRLGNSGIEVSDQQMALTEARTALTVARTDVHTANPAVLEPATADGLKIVTSVEAVARQGNAELRFRRRGLAVSLAAILLVVVGLALKVRQIDRERGVGIGGRRGH